jgi:hypothetical protein
MLPCDLWKVLAHSPYRPELLPWDFLKFGFYKNRMKVFTFGFCECVKAAVAQSGKFFADGILLLLFFECLPQGSWRIS